MIRKLSLRPWFTSRNMVAEYGDPPAVVFALQIAGLNDEQLIDLPQMRAPRRQTKTSAVRELVSTT